MLRPITQITITQSAPPAWPARKSVFYFNFVTAFEAKSNWNNLTNTGSVTLPKKIYYRDYNTGTLQPMDKNLGGFSTAPPYFLRGDKITIAYGYKYTTPAGNEVESVAEIFNGFISRVGSKNPFTLELEDNMFILKTIAAPDKHFAASTPLKTIIETITAGTGFAVKCIGDNFIGDFNTSATETVAQVLERLRKDFRIETYFRGNELRTGVLVYDETETLAREQKQPKTFNFNKTVIDDNLQYMRRDEVKISAKCVSINKKELEQTTREGQKKTKKERLEVTVGVEGGETRTLHFWNVTTAEKLKELGEAELKKYFYDGLRGSFKTFAIPFLQCGDNIDIINPDLPEQNGKYRVREVEYMGGVDGHFQNVFLDYKIN